MSEIDTIKTIDSILARRDADETAGYQAFVLMLKLWPAAKAALRAVAVVPEEWQVVPKEMTEEMIDAALRFDASNIGLRMTYLIAGMYRAALAVAPPPPQNKGEAG